MRKTTKKSAAKKPGIGQREKAAVGKDTDKAKRPDMKGASSDVGYGSGQRGVSKSDEGGKKADNRTPAKNKVGVAPSPSHYSRADMKRDDAKGVGTATSHNMRDNDSEAGDAEISAVSRRNPAENIEGRDPTR